MDGATSEDSTSRFETDTHVADRAIQQQETMYACTICFQTATYPVASTCGHLFCWECLFTWLRGRPRPCPVCRTNLIQGVNIIPIFTFTGGDVDECPAREPQSNTNTNAAPIPQRPPPPSPHRIPRPIPLPSPVRVVIDTPPPSPPRIPRPIPLPSLVRVVIDTVDDLTPSVLEEIIDDLTDNFEISRERVDSLGQTVENLVQQILRLRQENDRNVQLIDSMNRRHAQEVEAIHRLYAEGIDGVRHIHTDARV